MCLVFQIQLQWQMEHEKKVNENPYLMTTKEANDYFTQHENQSRDMLVASRNMLKDIPVIGQLANTLLYHVSPEGYRFVVCK